MSITNRRAIMAHFNEQTLNFTLKELSLSRQADGDAAARGGSSSVELRDRKKLVCVEYPAVVKSVEKMLETLGGEQTLSKTFSDPSRRLELRFRPQDPFCHSVCGNRLPSTNLLLRVRRRVRKKDPKDAEIQMDIVGIIGTTYKFQGMVDFQCLAVSSLKGKDTSLYDKIILHKAESQAFFQQDVPNFLPPAIFSRLDCPVDYFYRPDSQHKLPSSETTFVRKNLIGLTRARRQNNAIFVSFNDPSVPTECLQAAKQNWARFCMKESDKRAEANVKEMFERRPIWSRNALKANTNIHPEKFKLLLPLFAYFMVTGPWRSLWVRLGYDPRKDPDSKKYQMLDYRIRCSSKHGYTIPNIPVKAKRSALNYNLPITFNKAVPQAANVMDNLSQDGPSTSQGPSPVSYQLKESSYIFRDGMLPPHRQMFYQLCDLEGDNIKEVIEQNNGNERVCDERDGWCVVGTTDKLRDLISGMIKKVVRKQKPAIPQVFQKRRRRGLIEKYPERDEEEEEEEERCGNKDHADDVDEEEEERGNKDDDDGDVDEEEEECGNKDDNDGDDDEEEEEDEFQPSEGSENEMETELLDYM